ncbi:MAG: hypothetical protein WCL39_08105, partial [Armatimonadota bacterium]
MSSGSPFLPGLIIACLIMTSLCAAQAAKTTDFVVRPSDAGEDDTLVVMAALEKCKGAPNPRLVFTKGTYHFAQGKNPKAPTASMAASQIDDLTIDGQGSELIFSGLTTCFAFSACKNLTIKNLAIDWQRPPFSTGKVIAVSGKTFDVDVEAQYPVKGGEPVSAFMDWDPNTRTYKRNGLDVYYSVEKTELVRPQVLRVFVNREVPIEVGSVAVLRHQVYAYNSFVFDRCENVRVEKVNVYTCPGMAMVASHCTNMHLERFNVIPRPGTDRLMSTTADAFHFKANKGLIRIKDCVMDGMG